MKPDRRRPEAKAYRKLYNTKRWHDIREAVLLRDRYTCQKCRTLKLNKSDLVCHHKDRKSKESPSTFYAGPFIALCKFCHDSAAQSEEKTGFSKEIGNDGWPMDERHPANR